MAALFQAAIEIKFIPLAVVGIQSLSHAMKAFFELLDELVHKNLLQGSSKS